MNNAFGATSTIEQVLQGVNLSRKPVLATGVSAGLGVETARAPASHGSEVVGAARDLSKARNATKVGGRHYEDCDVAEIVSTPGIRGGVRPYVLDPKRSQALWQKSEQLVGERFSAN